MDMDIDDYDLEPTTLPHNGSATSQIAAQMAEPFMPSIRLRMLKRLVNTRPIGLTSDGAAEALRGLHQSTSQRYREMAIDGLCVETTTVRPTRSGCPAFVWQPTVKGVLAIEEGWYTGAILDPAAQKKARKARPSLRFALREALDRLQACSNNPSDHSWIPEMRELTQPQKRAKFSKEETP
jgi:hypothetical protein